MKYLDIKTIQGKCGGVGSWLGNALSSPAPGNIFYYKEHHRGQYHHGHHGPHYQRGGSCTNARGKSRKYARKYKSNSNSKSKSSMTKKQRSKEPRNNFIQH